jgi:hypothetical protein
MPTTDSSAHSIPVDGLPPEALARQKSLERVLVEVEKYASKNGWDGPVRVFALVNTAQALETDPSLKGDLHPDALAAAIEDPSTLTAVEQDGLPHANDLEELLAHLAWPETVQGCAVCAEQIVVPDSVEKDVPENDEEAVKFLMSHPERQDVRLVAGVLRTGETWAVARARNFDDDLKVAGAADLAPALTEALATTLSD